MPTLDRQTEFLQMGNAGDASIQALQRELQPLGVAALWAPAEAELPQQLPSALLWEAMLRSGSSRGG